MEQAYQTLPEKVDFNFHVRPILSDRCYTCHGPDNNARKADFRLDTEEGAFAALTSGGHAFVAGNLGRSKAIERIVSDNPEFMMPPPESNLSLNSQEVAIIAKWIEQGADFGGWKEMKDGEASVSPKKQKAPDLLKTLGEGVAPAPEKALASFKEMGALVIPISQKNNLIRIDASLVADKVSDETLSALKGLEGHVTDLNLAGSSISDKGLAALASCSKLTRLHLEKTKVTDAGIKSLAGLKNLQYLNLYGTGISDAGVAHLSGSKELKKIYLWQTKVSDKGATALQKSLPNVKISRGWAVERKPVSDKTIIAGFIADRCCDKAHKAGTVCSRTCCITAVAGGSACGECNKPKSADEKAYDKLAAEFDAGSCCGKAHKAGNKCDHECCTKAVAENKVCLKCNKEAKARLAKAEEAKAKKDAPKKEAPKGGDKADDLSAQFKAGSCCDKAAKAGKACSHGCCVKAAASTQVCKKCNS